MSRPLPIQSANFPALRRSAQAYIDKTRIIAAMLADRRCQHLFLSRPRRFGKTLLVSTLEALFQGHRDLFAGTWIDRDGYWDWAQPSRPVIRLDMSTFTGPVGRMSDLEEGLYAGVARLYRKFSLPLPGTARQAYILLGDLIEILVRNTGQKPVVLIDEYDTPFTANLDHPDLTAGIADRIRAFYGILKGYADHTHFAFMTGITRVSHVGLFSGANHFLDLSFDPEISTLLGYTQTDLEYNADIRAAVAQGARNLGCPPDDLLQALEQKYNGYLFAREGTPVYNPFSLNRCLDTLQHPVHSRAWSLDSLPNYWAESGTPHLLFHVWRQNLMSEPRDLMKTDIRKVAAANFRAGKPDLVALMYQSGYLTRRLIRDPATGREQEILALPNAEVEDTWLDTFLDWLEDEKGKWQVDGLDAPLTRQLRHAMETRKARDICNVVNTVLCTIPPHLQFPKSVSGKKLSEYEAYYHSILHAVLRVAGLTVVSERDADGNRMDLGVETESHALVFELKLNGDAEQAARQALARMYTAPWQDGSRAVTVFGLNFISARRLLEMCVKCSLGRFDPIAGRWQHEPVPGLLLASLRGWPDDALDRFEARQTIDWDEVHMLQTRRS